MKAAIFAILVMSPVVAAEEPAGRAPQGSEGGALSKAFSTIGSDFVHLFTVDSASVAAIGSVAAIAAHSVDEPVNVTLHNSSWVDDAYAPAQPLGLGIVQAAAAIGTYVAGRLTSKPKVAHIGLDLLRAQLIAQAVTYSLKYAVSRERPDGSDTNSFPSGHATVTFASASVLSRHFGWAVAVPTYATAMYVGSSRLHEERHYLSDVTLGATIGIIAGRTVTRHGRSTWQFGPVVDGDSVRIVITRVGGVQETQ